MGPKVYIVGPDEAGPMKIGATSAKIEHRINGLQAGYPGKLYSFGVFDCPGAWGAEATAHRLLWKKLIFGEWFDVTATEAREAVQSAIDTKLGKLVPDTTAERNRSETMRKIREAHPLWLAPSSEISVAEIAKRVGLSEKALYTYLGARCEMRDAYLGRREVAQYAATRRKRKGKTK